MEAREIERLLAEPFRPEEVQWKPQAVNGSRALAVAYVDARTIMDRLDSVVGSSGWSDTYEVLQNGCVVCTLHCSIAGIASGHSDVGSPSDQKDEGDRLKSAFSDALKRAAVKFGIGRYLYRLPLQWCAWDAQHKRFQETPALPDWAHPSGKAPGRKQPTAKHHDMMKLQQRVTAAAERFAKSYGVDISRLVLDLQQRFGGRAEGSNVAKWPETLWQEVVDAVKVLESQYQTEKAIWDAKSSGTAAANGNG